MAIANFNLLGQNDKFGRHYNNFESIDWMVDRSLERLRHQFLKKLTHCVSIRTKIKIFMDRFAGWIIIILLGLMAGLTAKVVSVGVNYLTDLREGICVSGILLNKNDCCWNSNSTGINSENRYEMLCDQWKTWSSLFGITSKSAGFVVNYIIFTVLALLYTFFASSVVYVTPYAGGGGIAEIKTILGGFIMRGYFGIVTYISKTLSLIPTVASGLVLGQEGPMVHICCCLANIICRINDNYRFNESKHHDIYFAGAASGVAVAFGAPIGGLLFSYEEISYYFDIKTIWKTFVCGTIGAITLASLEPSFKGTFMLYHIDYTVSWKIFEITFFILIGVAGGLYGALFIYSTLKFNKYKYRFAPFRNPFTQVLVTTLITSLICFPNYFTRLSSHHLLDMLFNNCNKEQLSGTMECDNILSYNIKNGLPKTMLIGLTLATLLKGSLMIVTNGLAVPSGLLVPSLTIGACVGKIVGIFVDYATMNYPNFFLFSSCQASGSSCILSGTYSVLGAAAFLAGTTHMTVALIIIMVELTGQISFIVPLMIVVIIAKLISHSLHESLHDAQIKEKRYPFLFSAEAVSLDQTAQDIMNPQLNNTLLNSIQNDVDQEQCPIETNTNELIVLPISGVTIAELKTIIKNYNYSGYPVVSNYTDKYLYGYVTRYDILTALNSDNTIPTSMLLNTVNVCFYESKRQPTTLLEGSIDNVINFNHIVNHSPVVVSRFASMEMVYMLFCKLGNRFVCVVDQGKLEGIITKKDIITYVERKLSFL